MADPTPTDPDKYKVVFENDRVRVLEYRDEPGARTSPHSHPERVVVTRSGCDGRLLVGNEDRDLTLEEGEVGWIDAQNHVGKNIGSTPSHALFVKLKDEAAMPSAPASLGRSG